MVLAAVLGACATVAPAAEQPSTMVVGKSGGCSVGAELRSWVVAGWGRHLRLDVGGGCGQPAQSVEYDDAGHYGLSGITSVVSVDPRTRIRPTGPGPSPEQIEGRYRLDGRAAQCVTAPRNYQGPYHLLGPNSSSGLRAAMEECQIPLPDHVPRGWGVLGTFPGINQDPGPPLR